MRWRNPSTCFVYRIAVQRKTGISNWQLYRRGQEPLFLSMQVNGTKLFPPAKPFWAVSIGPLTMNCIHSVNDSSRVHDAQKIKSTKVDRHISIISIIVFYGDHFTSQHPACIPPPYTEFKAKTIISGHLLLQAHSYPCNVYVWELL